MSEFIHHEDCKNPVMFTFISQGLDIIFAMKHDLIGTNLSFTLQARQLPTTA